MKIPLLLLSLILSCALPAFAEVPWKDPATAAAGNRYQDALQNARRAYAADLEPAVKAAMAGGSLEEANAINDLKKTLVSGGMPAPGQKFKTPRANEARARFERSVAGAQRQYATDLQTALKKAMTAGDLNEANSINNELKSLSATALSPEVTAATATPAPLGAATAGHFAEGLLLTRYPMHPSQADGNRYTGYVPYTDLGKPLAAPKTLRSISEWKKDVDENAVVSGFIRIDQPGRYEFRTSSGYDRNELLIDGKVVCKFRDGENKAGSADLRAGALPIVCVAYAHSTTVVKVQWMPPGAKDFTDLPASIFSH